LKPTAPGHEAGSLKVNGGSGSLSYDPEAAERLRNLLSGRDDVLEKRMVGGLSFLINGNMCCGITGTALMVRVGADGREEALREAHVRPMQFAGRALSGFICVEPAGFATDDELTRWVQRGLAFVAGLPAKPVGMST
jgi:TfoX/Sxy family transcriptional regulator of competence genes